VLGCGASVALGSIRKDKAINISQVRTGDVIACDVLDFKFFAVVIDLEKDEENSRVLRIDPITRNCSHYRVNARQVKGHYKKQGRGRK